MLFSGFVVFVFVWLFAGKCMLAHPLQIIWCIVLGVCMGSREKTGYIYPERLGTKLVNQKNIKMFLVISKHMFLVPKFLFKN